MRAEIGKQRKEIGTWKKTRLGIRTRRFTQWGIARFATNALPPLETLADGTIHGFVTGRHMLDRNITDDSATYGGYLRLALVQAEHKVPAKLLRAECKMEELAQMAAQKGGKDDGMTAIGPRITVHYRIRPDPALLRWIKEFEPEVWADWGGGTTAEMTQRIFDKLTEKAQ